MAKVLIATLYNADPVLLAANRLGPDRLILLVNKKPNPEQDQAYDLIKQSLGRVVDVKPVKIDLYDIFGVTKKCVEVIDMQPRDDAIFVNLTAGRKTQALGLLYAAYARNKRVKKIAYNPEEDRSSVVYLPKLSFKLTDSQRKVLDAVESLGNLSYADMAEKINISKAMLYKNIDDLRDMDYISTEDGLKLTDAGKIARL